MPGQYESNGPIGFDRHAPCKGGLVRIGRTNDGEIRNRTQSCELLDRLMRRTIFAQRDAVVREHVNDMQSHQRGEPDGRTHVIGKNQKRRTERYGSAMRGDAVKMAPIACSRTPKCRLRPDALHPPWEP